MNSLPIEYMASCGLECVKRWCTSKAAYQTKIGGTTHSPHSRSQVDDILSYEGSVPDVRLRPGLEKRVLQSSLDIRDAIDYSWEHSAAPQGLLAAFRENLDSSECGKMLRSSSERIYPVPGKPTPSEYDIWVRMLRLSQYALQMSIARSRNLSWNSLMRENGLEVMAPSNTSHVTNVPRSANGRVSSRTADEMGQEWPMPGSATNPFPELDFGDSNHWGSASGTARSSRIPNSTELYDAPIHREEAWSNPLPGQQMMIPMLGTAWADLGLPSRQNDIETLSDAPWTSAAEIHETEDSGGEGNQIMSARADHAYREWYSLWEVPGEWLDNSSQYPRDAGGFGFSSEN